MRLLLLVCAAACSLAAQTATIPPAPKDTTGLPQNWYGAGAAYSFTPAAATSRWSGWAAYAHLVSPTVQAYSFTAYNAYYARASSGGFQPVTSTATGFLVAVKQIAPVTVFLFGAAGATLASTVGNSFPYGGLVDVHLGKGLWHLDVGYQQILSSSASVPTQKSLLLGLGRTF